MQIVVNGEPVEIQKGLTVQQWIQAQKVAAATAAIEYNGQILVKERWPVTALQEGDRLEVFQFLGGG